MTGMIGHDDAAEIPDGAGRVHASPETRWLRAILSSVHEGMLVFDPAGLILEVNPAFSDMFGYGPVDLPIVPPYPWWPTVDEDPDALDAIWTRHKAAASGLEGVAEFRYYTREREPVWIASADAVISGGDDRVIAVVRTFRDITGQKESQARRAAAARVSADLANGEDLATLLSVAQHGFELLFGGGSTTQLDVDERYLFGGGRRITPDEVAEGARAGLAGTTSADATKSRPGILLLPQTSTAGVRVWVQFRKPRRIPTEEMIVADLLAQAFALSVDRLVSAEQAATTNASLKQAIDSHRNIGQAVGILVERYRLPPAQAFDRLRQASQNRNMKVRELAARVVETGADPETA